MKMVTTLATLLVILASLIDVTHAQDPRRRPGNGGGQVERRPLPGPGGGHVERRPVPGPGGGHVERRPAPRPYPDYRPEPAPRPRPDYRPEPAPRPRPDYRPEPAPRPRPDYRPAPTPPGSYNPPRTTAYRPVYRTPERTYYGTRNYHRPPMYRPIPYARYRHSPWNSVYVGPVRYYRSYDYYSYVRTSFPNYVYLNWIYWPVTGYSNGYYVFDNYPYYVYNGYRYRYSSVDQCNYQLVDSYTHQVVRSYWNQTCARGFDQCSFERDNLNDRNNDFRYFCSETFRDEYYDYSRPTYDYGHNDYGNGYGNDYGYNDYGQDCYDYDYNNDVCYDRN